MNVDTRQRLIAAADRGLRWRREQIMAARLAIAWIYHVLNGRPADWHSLFDCDRCGHHPLRGTWVGPYDLEDTVETSGCLRGRA